MYIWCKVKLVVLGFLLSLQLMAQKENPVKLAVVGLTHSHVHWILGRPAQDDIQIVGIVEPNLDLAERLLKQHKLSMDLHYKDMETMLKNVRPEAVTAFGSIYEHLAVVEKFAPLGIHVMVEKPLAVNMEHAQKMASLAKKHSIHLLTNYETSWYPTNQYIFTNAVQEGKIGEITKIVVHDGHQGPKEIGVNQEFLDWLTDPVLNGGGAITDFGCYGANLITWLLQGEQPKKITAITHQIKPETYPKVDDEANILIEYENTQGIIQASWNWPFSRKDMEVYGQTGYYIAKDRNNLEKRLEGNKVSETLKLPERPYPYDDPFALFASIIKDKIELPPFDVYSLENNLMVVRILDAARESAKTGKHYIFK